MQNVKTAYASVRKGFCADCADDGGDVSHVWAAEMLRQPSCDKTQAVAIMATMIARDRREELFSLLAHPPPTDPEQILCRRLPPEILVHILADRTVTDACVYTDWLHRMNQLASVCHTFYCVVWSPSIIRAVIREILREPTVIQRLLAYNSSRRPARDLRTHRANGAHILNHMSEMHTMFDMERSYPRLWAIVSGSSSSASEVAKAAAWRRLLYMQISWARMAAFTVSATPQATHDNFVSMMVARTTTTTPADNQSLPRAVRYKAHFGQMEQSYGVPDIVCTRCGRRLWFCKSRSVKYRQVYYASAMVTITRRSVLCDECLIHGTVPCGFEEEEEEEKGDDSLERDVRAASLALFMPPALDTKMSMHMNLARSMRGIAGDVEALRLRGVVWAFDLRHGKRSDKIMRKTPRPTTTTTTTTSTKRRTSSSSSNNSKKVSDDGGGGGLQPFLKRRRGDGGF